MPNAVVGALRVLLSMDTAEFDAATHRVSNSAKAWSKDLTNIGRQATAVGSALTKTVTLPLVGIGVAAVKAASDFESSFAGVRKTVDGVVDSSGNLTQAGLEIQQGMRDMAKEIPVSVDELNRIGEAAGALGIKKGDILQFTRTMADLGVTTNLTAEEAATATAQIQNIFGAAGKDVDRFGATLVALGNAGASTEKDIIEMGKRIAGAGNQVGLSQAQVLGFASALSSVGINAEAGGSAISRVFLKINDAVAKGGGDLAEFARIAGMTGPAFKKAFETDAAAATTAFIAGLGRLKKEGENVNATLEGVVGKNIILKDTLLRASGAGKLLTEQLDLANKAWKDNSALTKEAAERYKTFDSQLKILWNQVKDVAITLGLSLLPVLKDLIVVATPMVQLLGQAAEMFSALPAPVRLTVVGFLGLAAAIGPIIWAFGQLATGAGTIIGAFKAKGIVMRALNADYLAMGGSVRGLAAAYWPLAAAIAAVWAAWKLGNTETVKNSIAEWALSSENLTAKLYRATLGLEKMTPEQARAAVAATAAAEAAREQAKAVDKTAQAATDFVGPMEEAAEATNNFTLRQRESAEETKKLAAAAKKAHDERLQQLKEAGSLESKIKQENEAFAAEAIKLEDDKKKAEREWNNWLGERRMENDAVSLVPIPSTMDLSKMMAPFKAAAKEVRTDIVENTFEGISDSFRNIGNTILAAVTGGGNIVSAIGSSLGKGIGEDLATNLSGFLTRNLGKTLGNAVGAMLPGLGALIGPGLELLGKGFKKLFGIGINDEIKKFNKEIEASRQKLLSTYGSFERIERLGKAVGVDLAGAWKSQGEAGKKHFDKLAADFEAAVAKMEADLEGLQGDLDDTFEQARDLGYEFDKDGKLVSVSFEKMQDSANEFGIDLGSLGKSFQAARLAADARKIIDTFTLLDKGLVDTGTILFGMKDEISKLVQESLKFGTTIPLNMKPWIQNLIDTGQLLDENGDKITDIGKIQFGAAIETQFERITTKIEGLIDSIGELVDILRNEFKPALDDATGPVPAPWDGWSSPPTPEMNLGGMVPQFSVGTLGRLGTFRGNFGSGMLAQLDGIESVITPEQEVPFAMDVLSRLNAPQGRNIASSSRAGGTPLVIENVIVLDGQQMKRWNRTTTIEALQNNEGGFRTEFLGAAGVKR